jgi:hypothetical protein
MAPHPALVRTTILAVVAVAVMSLRRGGSRT